MTSPLLETLRQLLGREFTIERELGGGGMARVFLAEDRALGRKIVLKVLPPDAAGSVSAERFKREVQTAARLQHPHIVPLLSAGEVNGIPYYTMPFVEGESLRARIAREHELPIAVAVRILREVADALAYAHGANVVHRDIKPDNVLLADQHALVADFGIAKAILSARAASSPGTAAESITQLGVALGTPAYMAPEQASADPNVDHRADIYALGALGYELLTGRPPFTGHSPQALLAAVISADARPIGELRTTVPPALARLIMRCLEKRPADRPQSAAEVLRDIEAQSTPTGMHAGTPRRQIAALAAIVAAVSAVGAAGGSWYARRPAVSATASSIAVMPFSPASADTALTRLGRDLVITLSANLDGIGAIRSTDPYVALGLNHDAVISAQAAATIAKKAGAGSYVLGSLVREGGRVRATYTLVPTAGGEPIARGSVVSSMDSISSLTDDVTRSILGQVWRRDRPPTPSTSAALLTKSIPALRAYLEGERARGDGRFPDAIAAFNRAIEADSTFWLAYLRNASTHQWLLMTPDTVLRRYRAHEAELPERDRALLAAGRAGAYTKQIAAFRAVASKYPDAWSAWEGSGDILFHNGPSLGFPLEQARSDLEHVVQLNPRWTEAWQHLLFIAAYTSGANGPGVDSITRIMRGFGYDSATVQTFGFSELKLYDLVRRSISDSTAIHSALADSILAGMRLGRMPAALAAFVPSFPLSFPGGGAATVSLSERALRSGISDRDVAGHRSAIVWSWASRGAYDSALAVAERFESPKSLASSLDVLTVAALAELSGGIAGAFETQFASRQAVPSQLPVLQRVQVHLMRGGLAAIRGDRGTLEAAIAAVQSLGSDTAAASAAFARRELSALRSGMEGNTPAAADSLAAIEYEIAELGHGFSTPIVRSVASRWFQAAGRNEAAERLLLWSDGHIASRRVWGARSMLRPLILLERGRLAEARGDPQKAIQLYTEFLQRFDKPMPTLKPLLAEAQAALAKLSRRGG